MQSLLLKFYHKIVSMFAGPAGALRACLAFGGRCPTTILNK